MIVISAASKLNSLSKLLKHKNTTGEPVVFSILLIITLNL